MTAFQHHDRAIEDRSRAERQRVAYQADQRLKTHPNDIPAWKASSKRILKRGMELNRYQLAQHLLFDAGATESQAMQVLDAVGPAKPDEDEGTKHRAQRHGEAQREAERRRKSEQETAKARAEAESFWAKTFGYRVPKDTRSAAQKQLHTEFAEAMQRATRQADPFVADDADLARAESGALAAKRLLGK